MYSLNQVWAIFFNAAARSAMLVTEKIDKSIENPRQSLEAVTDKAVEIDYLKRQRDSINKVDQLILEAEQSLKELKKEFYQRDGESQEAEGIAERKSSASKKPVDSQKSTSSKSLKPKIDSKKGSKSSSSSQRKPEVIINDETAQVNYYDVQNEKEVASVELSDKRFQNVGDRERPSRCSILKYRSVLGSDDNVAPLLPIPTSEHRFLCAKNSVFLKMVSASDESITDIEETDENRVVKIVNDPSRRSSTSTRLSKFSQQKLVEALKEAGVADANDGEGSKRSSYLRSDEASQKSSPHVKGSRLGVLPDPSSNAKIESTPELSLGGSSRRMISERKLDSSAEKRRKLPADKKSDILKKPNSSRSINEKMCAETSPASSKKSNHARKGRKKRSVGDNTIDANVIGICLPRLLREGIDINKLTCPGLSDGGRTPIIKSSDSVKKQSYKRNTSSSSIRKESGSKISDDTGGKSPIETGKPKSANVHESTQKGKASKRNLSSKTGDQTRTHDRPTKPASDAFVKLGTIKQCCLASESEDHPCCTCSHNSPVASEVSVVSGETACSCKAEWDMLRGIEDAISPRKLPSMLKSGYATKGTPLSGKRTTFCAECAPLTPPEEPQFVSEVSRIAKAHGLFMPPPTETSGTDPDTDLESHLNTITEKTEATSSDAAQLTDDTPTYTPEETPKTPEIPTTPKTPETSTAAEIPKLPVPLVPEKSKLLTIQHLPQIDIRPPLVMQRVFEIEIKPTGSVNMQIPAIRNVCYEEVLHAEGEQTVYIEELMKDNAECYKYADEDDTSVMIMEPCIELQSSTTSDVKTNVTFKKDSEPLHEFDDIKPCLREYDTDSKPSGSHMKKIKSNVSFKQNGDDKIKGNEGEDVRKTTESPPVEVPDAAGAIAIIKIPSDDQSIKDIKSATYDHPYSTIMIVESGAAAIDAASSETKVSFVDVSKVDEKVPEESEKMDETGDGSLLSDKGDIEDLLQDTYQACGCSKQGDTIFNTNDALIDESLDTYCHCYDNAMMELMPTSRSDEMKESQEQILEMEKVLYQLEQEKHPKETSADDIDKGQAVTEEKSDESTVEPPVERDIERRQRIVSIDEIAEEEISTRQLSKGEDLAEDGDEAKPQEDVSANDIEGREVEPNKSDRSEKGTPLFTTDDNLKAEPPVPKSVSQYFSDTNLSDEAEDENDVERPRVPRLSVLSDNERRQSTSLPSSNDLVEEAITQLNADLMMLDALKDGPKIDCDCICKRANQQMGAGIVVAPVVPVTVKEGVSADKLPTKPSKASKSSKTGKSPDTSKIAAKSSSKSPKASSSKSGKKSSSGSAVASIPVQLPSKTSKSSKEDNRSTDTSECHSCPLTTSSTNEGNNDLSSVTKPSNIKKASDSRLGKAYSVGKKTSFILETEPSTSHQIPNATESEESIYVVMHDISTQVSLDSVQSEWLSDKKYPRVKISIDRNTGSYSKKKQKVKSKDQYQQSQNGGATRSSSDSSTTSKTKDDSTIIQPVIVHYETRGMQRSLECHAYPHVKLHKLRACNNVDSPSTNETELDSHPIRNAPFGDTPIMPEFIPLNIARISEGLQESDQSSSLRETRNLKLFKSPKHNYTSSSSGTTETRLEETLSEGEIKCKCSVSIGEMHVCRVASDIKAKTNYLKKHPEALVRREFPGEDVRLTKQRTLYDNWVTFYASKRPPATTSSSDTGELSTDT